MDVTDENRSPRVSRRSILIGGASAAGLALTRPVLAATPECAEQTEEGPLGPMYKPGAPEKSDFVEADMPASWARLTLEGRVLTTRCAEIAGSVLDVWQADSEGEYDLVGYRLRGKLRSAHNGRYQLRTILPGAYPLRAPHIHFIVTAPGFVDLTTQLYLYGHPANADDPWYSDALAIKPHPYGVHGVIARFDFVLQPV